MLMGEMQTSYYKGEEGLQMNVYYLLYLQRAWISFIFTHKDE